MGSTRATDEKEKWEKWAPPPQLSVVAQLLTAPWAGKLLQGGNSTQHLPPVPGWLWEPGDVSTGTWKMLCNGHWGFSEPSQLLCKCRCRRDQEKGPEVINFCHKSKEMEKNGKNGMGLQRISGFLPVLVNSQSLHRQPCRYFTWQQSSKSTSWQS